MAKGWKQLKEKQNMNSLVFNKNVWQKKKNNLDNVNVTQSKTSQ